MKVVVVVSAMIFSLTLTIIALVILVRQHKLPKEERHIITMTFGYIMLCFAIVVGLSFGILGIMSIKWGKRPDPRKKLP